MTSHDETAQRLLLDIAWDAASQMDERRTTHRIALATIREDMSSTSFIAQQNIETVSLMSAYITAVVNKLYMDKLLPAPPHFEATVKARNMLMMAGGSDSQAFFSYEEMADIAVTTCMMTQAERASAPPALLVRMRNTIAKAMEAAHVNAGYLEATGFFLE